MARTLSVDPHGNIIDWTAIGRAAAVVSVADLQRQLRQAQEERGRWQRWALAAGAKWTWFVSPMYRYALNLMCQTYSDGKQEVREAKRDAAEQRALAEGLVAGVGHWVEAYGPDLIVYPSKEEIRAVNETPEFRIGRNATMQVVSEGLQAILAEAQREGDGD